MKKESSDLLLLDVNVLVALAWPHHSFHRAATRRMEQHSAPWATCSITQLGFLRVSLNPAVANTSVSPAEAVSLLAAMVADPWHQYIEALPSPVASKAFPAVLGHQQITDAYLVWIAGQAGARFLTFDTKLRRLPDVEVL